MSPSNPALSTWYVPPARRAVWDARPRRSLEFAAGERRVSLAFPEPGRGDLEPLALDLLRAAPGRDRAAEIVARVARRFLDRSGSERARVVELLVAVTGRARAMIEDSYDHLFRSWAEPPALEDLLPRAGARRLVAPRLVYHVLAGNVPWAGVESLFAAVLVGASSLVKLSSREPVLTGLVAQALAEEDRGWANALTVLHWPGGDHALEEAVLAEADAIVAYGDNDTVASYATRLAHRIASGRTLFVPRGHRVSVALIGPEALADESAARALAFDLACEDQEGCLSPAAVYLVGASAVAAERFAVMLAEAMARREEAWPRRTSPGAEAATVQQARSAAEFEGVRVWAPERSTAWTVVLDPTAGFEPALPARFAKLRVVDTMRQAVEVLLPARGLIATVGIAGWKEAGAIEELALLAPGRVCALGSMQRPPAGWNHEGASDVAALVRWLEWEGEPGTR